MFFFRFAGFFSQFKIIANDIPSTTVEERLRAKTRFCTCMNAIGKLRKLYKTRERENRKLSLFNFELNSQVYCEYFCVARRAQLQSNRRKYSLRILLFLRGQSGEKGTKTLKNEVKRTNR